MGSLQQALPFALGAFVQAFGQIVNIGISKSFNREFDSALNDSTGNSYSLPTNFDEEYIKARFSRDFDITQAILTLFAVLPAILILMRPGTIAYVVGLTVVTMTPICMYIILVNWPPISYQRHSIGGLVSIVNLCAFIMYVALAIGAYFWNGLSEAKSELQQPSRASNAVLLGSASLLSRANDVIDVIP